MPHTPPPPLTLVEIPDEVSKLATLDLTATQSDLVDRLRNGFSMANLESPLVAERQAWYLNRPDQLREMLERSRRYLYHISTEIEQRGMPLELALLPMVESAFNPMALSPAQASGLWQFIPSTGRNYNLAQNFWVDQRRDIVASTQAALEYLQTIYEMHGDWHLALASYNWGENAVARAIHKNQAAGLPTDYQSLNMPNETRYYVPKLQALKNIIAQPHLFGVTLPRIPNRPYFATVETPGNIDISTAARLANMSVAEFVALNPAYNRPLITRNSGSNFLIPAQNVDQYLANLQSYDKPLSNWTTYTANRGDRLETIAAKFGVAAANLRQMNGLSPRAKIGPGQTLLVPIGGPVLAQARQEKTHPAVTAKTSGIKAASKNKSAARARVATRPSKPAARASKSKPPIAGTKNAPTADQRNKSNRSG